jgi:hypothetical protein
MWGAGISLEAVILLRSFRSRMLASYPLFYAYMACVLLTELSRYLLHAMNSPLWVNWYWGTEFLCLLMGYFVIFDILEKTLAPYEGPKKFARNVGLLVFASVVAFTTIQLIARNRFAQGLTSVEVDRNLRSAELVLLGGVLLIVANYGIPIGRNLKGIILGYGLYVAAVVMDDAARSYLGRSFQGIFSAVKSYSYFATLLVWAVALWSYHPNPVPSEPGNLNGDYQVMVTKTKNALGAVRSQLGKGGRT